MIEFQTWPKIARLNRDIVITEKIDGTNAAIVIEPYTDDHDVTVRTGGATKAGEFVVYAQSRKRLVSPGADNFGFGRWVFDNAAALVDVLGPGRHFGEWWGSGIQRGYGLREKRFSLFNTKRHGELLPAGYDAFLTIPGLRTVPVLYEGHFSETWIRIALGKLKLDGSVAAPGFDRPEGIVIYHTAANMMFKVTLENDEAPKSLVLAQPDDGQLLSPGEIEDYAEVAA